MYVPGSPTHCEHESQRPDPNNEAEEADHHPSKHATNYPVAPPEVLKPFH